MAQSLLMCFPDYFGVQYTINPWMEDQIGSVNSARATDQWIDFYSTLKQFADIKLLAPHSNVPDLVFTANAGLIRGNQFIPSRFHHDERRAEEPFFREWFQNNGYQICEWNQSIHFEGAGDALFQPGCNLLWASHGFRTDPKAHDLLATNFQVHVIPLRLIDPRFYHLDTCFCPLLDGKILYYPKAFDAASRQLIEKNVAPQDRIVVSDEDAVHFACNAVLVDRNIILNYASDDLAQRLKDAGYNVFIRPVTEFMKAGGANKCLTLELTPCLPKDKNQVKTNSKSRITDSQALLATGVIPI